MTPGFDQLGQVSAQPVWQQDLGLLEGSQLHKENVALLSPPPKIILRFVTVSLFKFNFLFNFTFFIVFIF